MEIRRRNKKNSALHIIGILFISLYVIAIFLPAFLNRGPLLQTDQPMWTAFAHLFSEEVFPSQKWFWGVITYRAGAGQIMGNIYSLPLILPWILTHPFGAATAVKLSMLISTLVFLISFFLLACRYMPRIYALLSSMVLLTPMFDNLVSGMWYNYFSLGCGFIFWVSCDKLYDKGSVGSIITAIISFALSIYAHTVGVVLCIAVWCSYVIISLMYPKCSRLRSLIVFMIIPFTAILLAFPQIQGIIGVESKDVTNDTIFQTPIVTSTIETLRRLFFIRVWGAVLLTKTTVFIMVMNIVSVLILFVTGIYSLFVKKEMNRLVPILVILLFTFILISRIYNLSGLNTGILKGLSEFYDRFQLLSQIYLVLMAGVGLHYLREFFRKVNPNKVILKIGFFILILCFGLIAARTPKKIFLDHTNQLGTLEASTVGHDTKVLWKWLNENVDAKNERVYFEDTYGAIHWNVSNNPESYRTHILALTSMYTDVCQVGGWGRLKSEFTTIHEDGTAFGKSVKDRDFSDKLIYEEMKLLNCRYVVAVGEQLVSRLRKVSFLKLTAEFKNYFVFENTAMKPAWAYKIKAGEKVEFRKKSPKDYVLEVEGVKGDLIQISMAYLPEWRAVHEGNEIPIFSHKALMQIRLPVDGRQTIYLRYAKSKGSIWLFTAGLVVLAFVIVFGYFVGVKQES